MLDGLARRAHCEHNELIDAPLLLRLHPLIGIVGTVRAVAAGNLARDLGCQIPDFEFFDSARAALTCEDALPCLFDAASERRHHAKPRDDNTPHAGSSGRTVAQMPRPELQPECREIRVSFSRSFRGI